jgi:uncharacterized damage-inducible protein DinB
MLAPSTRSGFGRLFRYNTWANERLIERLGTHAEPIRIAAHSLTAERIWMMRLNNEHVNGAPIWPALSAEACARLASANAAAYRAFVDALDEDDLERPIRYRNSKGTEYRTAIADVLTHVLLHSAYHRGQAATALRAAGAEPPVTDFIGYVREGN